MTDAAPTRRPPLFFVMLLLLVGVWGYVFYAFARGWADPVAETGGPAPIPGDSGVGAVHAARRPYAADYRDPFAWPEGLYAGEAPPAEEAPPAVPVTPPLRLQGVVGEVALLRVGPDPEVLLGRVGETVAGARIVAVRVDHVVVRFEGRTFTVSLVD